MGDLVLRLLGPPEVSVAGEPVRFDTRKAVALLAYLAVTGRGHGREVLAGLLWPDAEATRARNALRRTLSVAGAVGPALRTRPDVSLDLDLVRCDVLEVRSHAASDEPARWRVAVDLASDTFLAGFSLRDSPEFDDWQGETAEGLRSEVSRLLGRLVEAGVAAGDLGSAVADARRRVRVDPLSEPAHADLVRVLAWSGDRPAALSHYRSLVRMLDRELGVPPLPQTVALHDAVRAGRLPAPAARPAPPAEAGGGPVPRPGSRPTPRLVGRDTARRRLREAWTTSAVSGSALGVVGSRGAGRTALAEDLSAHVTDLTAPVIRLAGYSTESDLPYGTVADLLRGLVAVRPEALTALAPVSRAALAVLLPAVGPDPRPPLPDGAGARWRLLDATYELLREVCARNDRSLLVLVDDAHLVDRSSSQLLGYLVRRLPPRVLVVGTWPTGEAAGPFPSAIVGSGPAATVQVGPLSDVQVSQVLADAGSTADPELVHRQTGGLPLLVVEHAAATGEGVGVPGSGGPVDLVAARFDGAPQTTQQVVGAAAVIGRPSDPALLRTTSGRTETEVVDAVEDAVARGLLVELADRSAYDTPHEMVRTVALSRTSLARVRLLHARAADALVRRHGIDPSAAPAAAVARHLEAAGRADEAAGWAWAAAQEAARLGADVEAVTWLRQAQALGHDPVDTRTALGDALTRLGRYREAGLAYEQAVSRTGVGDRRAGLLEHRLGSVHERAGDWELAEDHLMAAAERLAATAPEDLASLARVTADLALVLHRQERDDEASVQARRAVALAVRSKDPAALARSRNVLGVVAARQGNASAAVAAFEAAARLADRSGDLDLQAAVHNNLARALAADGRLEDAVAVAETALALGRQRADRHRLAALHSHLADLFHAAGDVPRAEQHLREAAVAFAEVDEAFDRPQIWMVVEW